MLKFGFLINQIWILSSIYKGCVATIVKKILNESMLRLYL